MSLQDIPRNLILRWLRPWGSTRFQMANKNIELNEQFRRSLDVMENTPKNVFITGRAGTGKSTLLDYFRSITRKKIVVLAPTGVAALNVRGQTIHSFFGFKPDITVGKVKKIKGSRGRVFKEIDAVVIDEISMVRADLMDCVEKFLRLNGGNPGRLFGGVQMIFIGDLYQLPPVVTPAERGIFTRHYRSPYFFSAQSFQDFEMEFVELEKIYRQKDDRFIGILNAIRNNSVTEGDLAVLNARVEKAVIRMPPPAPGPSLQPPSRTGRDNAVSNNKYTVHLLTTNAEAARINEEHLRRLRAGIHIYKAEIEGDFARNSYPAEVDLRIASGAQVMLLNNDQAGRWVNGSIGQAVKINREREIGADVICVRLQNGDVEDVRPHSWELFHYRFNEDTHAIDTEPAGSFTQYPLRLAWAITIHKSQGKTFDRVALDLGRGAFACGQTYVALSRCTSLEGIVLKRPVRRSDVRMDWNIVRFMTQHQYHLSERDMPLDEKITAIKDAIRKGESLEITYLNAKDEKSRRRIHPLEVGEQEYEGVTFAGLRAHCLLRGEERIFRVDRILEIRPAAGL